MSVFLLLVLSIAVLIQFNWNRKMAVILEEFKIKLNETRSNVSDLNGKLKKLK